eukprot:5132335-Pleurochrysis_carterae.AAC.2
MHAFSPTQQCMRSRSHQCMRSRSHTNACVLVHIQDTGFASKAMHALWLACTLGTLRARQMRPW